MRYVIYFMFMIGALMVFIGITTLVKQPASHIPQVNEGVLDLSDMNELQTTVVALDGTWDFYWQTFTHTNENDISDAEQKSTIAVPSSWGNMTVNEEKLSNQGYGTYQMTIVIPDEQIDNTFGLYIPSVATAYKLWVDDKLIISNGTIGTNKNEMIPVNYARTAYFQPETSTIELTMEVANFSQRKAGLWESIQFGFANEISFIKEKNIALQLLVIGALVIMGLYNIFVFLLRSRLIYSMFLGVLCILFALRTLVIGETFLLNVFPTFPWELQVKLEYLPIVFSLPLLVKYVHELYKEDRFVFFEKIVNFISIFFAIIVLVTPAIIYTKYLVVFLIVIPLTLIYFGYIFLKAYVARRPASLFTLIGFTIFIVTAMNDSLYFFNMINNGTYSSTGFLVFILSQTFVHAIQFSEANYQVEKLSEELMETNRSLEKKVEHRTKELTLLYSKLRESEHERKNLMSDLAHELSKPLTLIKGYSEAVVDEKLPPEKDYLQIINRNANISERLIHDLSELSKLETRQMKMLFQKVSMKHYPSNIVKHHRWTVESEGKFLKWNNENEWIKKVPEDVYLFIDPDRVNQVFINIIENALHYAEKGESIYLETEWDETLVRQRVDADEEVAATLEENRPNNGEAIGECIIKIIDEGVGIRKEEIPYIFNRLYRGVQKKDGINSRGLGLAISKEIIEMHGGKIWVESELNKGSTFYIALPVFRSSINE